MGSSLLSYALVKEAGLFDLGCDYKVIFQLMCASFTAFLSLASVNTSTSLSYNVM